MGDLSYSELITLQTFEDRINYLMRSGIVAEETFGGHRWLNQRYYRSSEWKQIRDKVIIRDDGCDLAVPGYDIHGPIYVHHINPIIADDIVNMTKNLFDLDNLITVSFNTHQFIHYGIKGFFKQQVFHERFQGDTKLW